MAWLEKYMFIIKMLMDFINLHDFDSANNYTFKMMLPHMWSRWGIFVAIAKPTIHCMGQNY